MTGKQAITGSPMKIAVKESVTVGGRQSAGNKGQRQDSADRMHNSNKNTSPSKGLEKEMNSLLKSPLKTVTQLAPMKMLQSAEGMKLNTFAGSAPSGKGGVAADHSIGVFVGQASKFM